MIAKAPVAGRSKTRMCPPCSPAEAAALAEAALSDTLAAVAATPADRRVLVLDGEPGEWLPDGFEVLPQRGGGLDERLAAAFEDVGGCALLIGMDTPQVTPHLLAASMAQLDEPGVDVVLGPAPDGGYWAVGIERGAADPIEVFHRVRMSAPETLKAQRERLAALGLRCASLPSLTDVDHFDDAVLVAQRMQPESSFARFVLPLAANLQVPA